MRLGISTATYFSKLVTEESFGQIEKLGLKTCEVFLTTFYEYTPQFGGLLAEKSKGLDIYSVHALTNQFEPSCSTAPSAQERTPKFCLTE